MDNWLHLFVSPRGRIGRRTYWHGMIVIAFVDVTLVSISGLSHSVWPALPFLATGYPVFCVFAKRLHDLGRSAWLMAAPLTMILVGVGLGVAYNLLPKTQVLGLTTLAGLLMSVVGFMAAFAITVWLGLAPPVQQVGPASAFD